MRFDRARGGGFTLLEVLMAVAVFGIAAMGLLIALGATLDGARNIQIDATVRHGLASRLASLSVGSLRPLSNDETENGVTYREEVEREEVVNDEKTILRGFWRVRVKAEWKENNTPQSWEVSHLVYRSDL